MSASVDLRYEHCAPEDVHPRHLATIHDAAMPGLNTGALTFVVSGAFANSVLERLPPEERSFGYSDARAFGVVAGRTITSSSGHTDIVLQAKFLGDGSDDAVRLVARLVEHEMAHVLINQRDGDLFHAYKRVGAPQNSHQALLLGLAAKASEEVRVERLLHRRNHDGTPVYAASVDDDLQDVRAQLVAAIAVDELSTSQLYDRVMQLLRDMTVLLTYAAAEELEGVELIADSYIWRHFAGVDYVALRDELDTLPIADEPLSVKEHDAAVQRIAVVLRRWHERLGYTVVDGEDGAKDFRIGGFAHEDADRLIAEVRANE